MEKQILTPEQFERAKREFEQRYGKALIGVHRFFKEAFSEDLTALLEQHKEMICTQCHEQHKASVFPDRPNPRDVNPYDIKAVHRARNPRKRT